MNGDEQSRKFIFKLELRGVPEDQRATFVRHCNIPLTPVMGQRIPPRGGLYTISAPIGNPSYEFKITDSSEGLVVRTGSHAVNDITASIPIIYLEPTEETKRKVLIGTSTDFYEI